MLPNEECRGGSLKLMEAWALIQYKYVILQYRKSHCGDKTVVRSSYVHNGISYTGKMTSLYWISPLEPLCRILHRSMYVNCGQIKIYHDEKTVVHLANKFENITENKTYSKEYSVVEAWCDILQNSGWFVNHFLGHKWPINTWIHERNERSGIS